MVTSRKKCNGTSIHVCDDNGQSLSHFLECGMGFPILDNGMVGSYSNALTSSSEKRTRVAKGHTAMCIL
jgi:hypothetical protein